MTTRLSSVNFFAERMEMTRDASPRKLFIDAPVMRSRRWRCYCCRRCALRLCLRALHTCFSHMLPHPPPMPPPSPPHFPPPMPKPSPPPAAPPSPPLIASVISAAGSAANATSQVSVVKCSPFLIWHECCHISRPKNVGLQLSLAHVQDLGCNIFRCAECKGTATIRWQALLVEQALCKRIACSMPAYGPTWSACSVTTRK